MNNKGEKIVVCEECLSAFKGPGNYFLEIAGYKELGYIRPLCPNEIPESWNMFMNKKEEIAILSNVGVKQRRERLLKVIRSVS